MLKKMRRLACIYRLCLKELKHIHKACACSYDGMKAAFKSEIAFRQDLNVCACLFILALLLPASLTQKLLMIMSLFIIMITELANTAIETTIDRISADIHPLSKKAKDIGSALVFLAFIQMVIVYLTIIIHLIFF
ncbi:MAG: diacylglycerol kinase [Alphaproteobacteria bacterium]|nr:diacylglycerol kinase [Alphaproteobacteria bacterium]